MKNVFFFLFIAVIMTACTSSGERNSELVTILESESYNEKKFYHVVEYMQDGGISAIEWDDSNNIPRNFYKIGDTVIVKSFFHTTDSSYFYQKRFIYGGNSTSILNDKTHYDEYSDSTLTVEFYRCIIRQRVLK